MSPLRIPLLLAFLTAPAMPALAEPGPLAPLPKDQAVSSHPPFETGACGICHARGDPANPGPARVADEVCTGCHDDFAGGASVKMDTALHPTAVGTLCVGCHRPHNSAKKKLVR
jgi:predicted CXXCH cytochrome family protein